jgi:hypothetical protein
MSTGAVDQTVKGGALAKLNKHARKCMSLLTSAAYCKLLRIFYSEIGVNIVLTSGFNLSEQLSAPLYRLTARQILNASSDHPASIR